MDTNQDKFKNQFRIASTRLNGWDYSAAGWYFVTMCTRARLPFFGEVLEGEMHKSTLGEIAHQFWQDIPDHFPHVSLDEFVIMPDHVHGIIAINPTDFVETQHAASLQNNEQEQYFTQKSPKSLPKHGSISAIVRSYKSAVTQWAGKNGITEFGWQTRFFDHIIRNEASLENLRFYIVDNPHKNAMGDDYLSNFEI